MTTVRTARLSGDALVEGVELTVSGERLDVSDGDQGIAGRLVTARGVPPLGGAGVAQGTALPQPSARRAKRLRSEREYRHESMELRRTGGRREFERYATLAMCLSRQVRL